jgi:hypothetical protein
MKPQIIYQNRPIQPKLNLPFPIDNPVVPIFVDPSNEWTPPNGTSWNSWLDPAASHETPPFAPIGVLRVEPQAILIFCTGPSARIVEHIAALFTPAEGLRSGIPLWTSS